MNYYDRSVAYVNVPASNKVTVQEMLKDLVTLAKDNQRIEAIKLVRAAADLSLKEAKDIIDVLIPPTSVPSYDDATYYVAKTYDGNDWSLSKEDNKSEAFATAKSYADYTSDVMVFKLVGQTKRTIVEV